MSPEPVVYVALLHTSIWDLLAANSKAFAAPVENGSPDPTKTLAHVHFKPGRTRGTNSQIIATAELLSVLNSRRSF